MGKKNVAVILTGIALVLLITGGYFFIQERSSDKRSVQVQAEVGLIMQRGLVYYPEMSFRDIKGVPHKVSSIPKGLLFSPKPGDIVPLLYDIRNPEEVRLNTFFNRWALPVFILLFGLAALVIGLKNLDLTSELNEMSGSMSYPSSRGVERAKSVSKSSPESSIQTADADHDAPGKSAKREKKPSLAEIQEIRSDKNLYGILQQFIDDEAVTDIIVTDYTDIAIRRGGRTHSTNLSFRKPDEYESLVDRLLLAAGVTYSTAKPIVDGMIGSKIRIHAVNKVLCETGPYLTIRISRFSKVTFAELCDFGLAPKEVFEYLRAIIHSGQTVLIAGEVGTGKTTLARALCAGILPEDSILVIEDTPEIKIEHPHARYMRTREANIAGVGKIRPSECIRAGMRMAMTRVIFGEIRDSEAAEAFIDVCVSGHPGISTIHARSAIDALNRLDLFLAREQHGVSRAAIREQVATALQVVVFTKICRKTGRRRIVTVKEILPSMEKSCEDQDVFNYGLSEEQNPVWKIRNPRSFFEDTLASYGFPNLLGNMPRQIS
jgi:Flp pilus assembly CpaF family ATPase